MEFAEKENINPKQSTKDWLQDHILTDTHKKFFCEFTIILSEWMLRLKDNNGSWSNNGSREWTLELIKQLKEVSNPISCAIDFWIDIILKGYVTKFSIEYT